MAYFPNGSEGDYYGAKYCNRCIHGPGHPEPPGWKSCPVMDLHWHWNYEQALNKDEDDPARLAKKQALNTLWPRDGVHNARCAMFAERPEPEASDE